MDHSASARRVLWWHRFFFRQPATVVLRATERKPTQQFADLDSSARALTHDYGARVLIDASNNSLPDATATKREEVLELEPMPRELLEELPELQLLHEALKSANLADVVWMCVGGNPADYRSLAAKWTRKPNDLEQVAVVFVRDLIGRALYNISTAVASNEHLQGLYDKFRESSVMPSDILKEMKIVRPSPDKVLRVVKLRTPACDPGGGMRILIPADAATALVLRTGITDTPSIEELKAMAKKELS
jgi:hypothetical protein